MNPAARLTRWLLTATLVGALSAVPTVAGSPARGGFLENIGQLDDTVLFSASGPGTSVYFTSEGLVIDVFEPIESGTADGVATANGLSGRERGTKSFARRGSVIRIRFDGATAVPLVEGRKERPGRYNFFLGADRARWHTGARAFTEVLYRGVWPGIDLLFRPGSGALEYDAILKLGADPSLIRFTCEGAELVTPEPGGSQRIETSVGALIHRLPVPGERGGAIFPDGAESPPPVLRGAWTGGWCTFLGGSGAETALGVISDAAGRPVALGSTNSFDFPTTPGAYDSSGDEDDDAYITKLTADGTDLVWSTLLGGGLYDDAIAAAYDSTGCLVVAGITVSADFPTTPGAFDTTASISLADYDVYVTKFSAAGDSLIWSTYLGKASDDVVNDLTLDGSDHVLLVGHTYSPWPTTSGAYKEVHDGYPNSDAFVTKLASTGDALVWSTLLGVDGFRETAWSFDLDSQENVVLGGTTYATDFPTTAGAYDSTFNGGLNDAFLAKVSADGRSLVWSTLIGGSLAEQVFGLGLEPWTEDVLAVGRTYSDDFPTTPGAFDRTYNGPTVDTVVLRVSADGSTLAWSTYLGGAGGGGLYPGDWGSDIAVGPAATPIVVGSTSSTDFPTTPDAMQSAYAGGDRDGFITILKNDGTDLLYSTLCGGSDDPPWGDGFGADGGNMVSVGEGGNIHVTGHRMSSDFPTFPAGVWDQTPDGASDAVVLMMPLPAVDAPALPASAASRLLLVCSPNPFREAAAIRFALPVAASVEVTVHDVSGRRVRALAARGALPAGTHLASWDGRNDAGLPVGAGVYFVRVTTRSQQVSESVVLLR